MRKLCGLQTRGRSAREFFFYARFSPQPILRRCLSRARSDRHAPCYYFFMVIAIIVTSWVGFSTIICLAFARVAARPRPLVGDNVPQIRDDVPVVSDSVSLVGDNVTAEVETPRRQTRTPEI